MQSDAELAKAARWGDREAYAAIYDRYADRVHDFCWSILRDRDEAAAAMQDTFVLAAQRLGQLRDPAKLRPWLFAIARHEAVRRGKVRSRMAPTTGIGDRASDDTGPEHVVTSGDAQAIVWAAAAGLASRDQVLLDLHLRQGLDGHELAEAIGVTPAHAYTLMNRLRDQVERSLGALLVARMGRDDCPELQTLLAGWDGRFTPLWRKRVARHVDDCDLCSESRRLLASPLALLAAAPLVPAPLMLRNVTLDRMERSSILAASEPGLPAPVPEPQPVGWPRPASRGGFPPALVPYRWARTAVAVAAAAVLAVVVGGASYLLFQDGDSTTVVAAISPNTTTTTKPEPSPSTTDEATTTTGRATTTTRDRAEARADGSSTTDGGGTPPAPDPPPPTTAPPPPPNPGPAVSVAAGAGEIFEQGLTCTPTSTTVTATVSDPDGVRNVKIHYTVGNSTIGRSMSGSGESYSAPFGPFGAGSAGNISVRVTAEDSAGNPGEGSTAVTLSPCVL